ncbi:hypothetical protein A2U01_0103972, partial [Trifolium medium]|nr:hypothetical protein [Trifolium medium]
DKLSAQQAQISEVVLNQKVIAAKQEEMTTKQDAMGADLKAILAILSQK